MWFYRAVCAFQKRIGILLTNSNGDLLSLFFRFMKGSALKLQGSFNIHGLVFEGCLFQRIKGSMFVCSLFLMIKINFYLRTSCPQFTQESCFIPIWNCSDAPSFRNGVKSAEKQFWKYCIRQPCKLFGSKGAGKFILEQAQLVWLWSELPLSIQGPSSYKQSHQNLFLLLKKKACLNEVCEISYNSSFILLYKEQ